MLSRYVAGLSALRAHAPDLPAHRLLLRVLAWRACAAVGARPLVRLHARSRMRLDALPGDRGVRTGIFLFRDGYEPSVRAAIDRFVQPGAVCYDIGANLGLWSLRMAERAGDAGRVFAFEPLTRNARVLRDNAARSRLGNITVLPIALGETAGEATIYVPDDVGRAALAPEAVVRETETVGVRTLDAVWSEQGRPAVAFVKLDIEGAEPAALRGGRRFFEEVRPVVCCEVNPAKLRNMGFAPCSVLDIFAAWRYRALAWSRGRRDLVPCQPSGDMTETEDFVFVPA